MLAVLQDADRPPSVGEAATKLGLRATTGGPQRQILLRHYPFRETAEEHREVVCSIHLGLIQGPPEIDAPIEAQRLDSFVEPNLCVAHLAARPRKQTTGRSA